MKKIKPNTCFALGILWPFVATLLFVGVAFVLPETSEEWISFLVCVLMYIPPQFLMVSWLLLRRAEKDGYSQKLLRYLTPAQICLLISAVFFTLALLFQALEMETVGGFLFFLWMILLAVSILLCIARAVKNRKARRQTVSKPVKDADGPQPGRTPDLRKGRKDPPGSFDYNAFRTAYKKVIAARLPKNIDSFDVQAGLLDNLSGVIPEVGMLAVELAVTPGRRGSSNTGMEPEWIASKVEKTIGGADLDSAEKGWRNLSGEQLIDAFILLDYYCFILSEEGSINIRDARARIGLWLMK